jgi:hypothetical protein
MGLVLQNSVCYVAICEFSEKGEIVVAIINALASVAEMDLAKSVVWYDD